MYPYVLRMAPTRPARMFSRMFSHFSFPVTISEGHDGRLSCPSFSSRVIFDMRSSMKRSISAFSEDAVHPMARIAVAASAAISLVSFIYMLNLFVLWFCATKDTKLLLLL